MTSLDFSENRRYTLFVYRINWEGVYPMLNLYSILKLSQLVPQDFSVKGDCTPMETSKAFINNFMDNVHLVVNRMESCPATPFFKEQDLINADALYISAYNSLPEGLKDYIESESSNFVPSKNVVLDPTLKIRARPFSELQDICELAKNYFISNYEFFYKTFSLATNLTTLKSEYSYINLMSIYYYLISPQTQKLIKAKTKGDDSAYKTAIAEYKLFLIWFCIEDFHNFYAMVCGSNYKSSLCYSWGGFDFEATKARGYSSYLTHISSELLGKTQRFDTDLLLMPFAGAMFCPQGRVPFISKFPYLTIFCLKYLHDTILKAQSDDDLQDCNFMAAFRQFLSMPVSSGFFKFDMPLWFENIYLTKAFTKRVNVVGLTNLDFTDVLSHDKEYSYRELQKDIVVLQQAFWGLLVNSCTDLMPVPKSTIIYNAVKGSPLYHLTGNYFYVSTLNDADPDVYLNEALGARTGKNARDNYSSYFQRMDLSYSKLITSVLAELSDS